MKKTNPRLIDDQPEGMGVPVNSCSVLRMKIEKAEVPLTCG